MLTIEIPETEVFNEATNEFINIKKQKLVLEHSLVSISKWESTWHIYFLDNKSLTNEQLLDYIRCMTLTQNVDPVVYNFIPKSEFKRIVDYIQTPQTATTFYDMYEDKNASRSKEIITSELIYYWMDKFGISDKKEKWPLSRLLTLIKIHTVKDIPQKKMSDAEILKSNRELNERRKKQLGTKG